MTDVSITRKVSFSAAHFYFLPDLSDQENKRRFKGSANKIGHGHNYELEITVAGGINKETGLVINFVELKRIIREHVVQHLDHKHLNREVPFFRYRLPTLENVALFAWQRLEEELQAYGARLTKVLARVNENFFVEYCGEGVAP